MKIGTLQVILLLLPALNHLAPFVDSALAAPSSVNLNVCINSAGKIFSRTRCRKGEVPATISSIQASLVLNKGERGEQGPKGDRGDPGRDGSLQEAYGNIVGTVTEFQAGCAAVNPLAVKRRKLHPEQGAFASNPSLYIPGSSFSARADSDGNFTIYNVPAGSYKLRLEGVRILTGDYEAFYQSKAQTEVSVQAGKTTYANPLAIKKDCCGNGVIDAGEVCDAIYVDDIDAPDTDNHTLRIHAGESGFYCRDFQIPELKYPDNVPHCYYSCKEWNIDDCK